MAIPDLTYTVLYPLESKPMPSFTAALPTECGATFTVALETTLPTPLPTGVTYDGSSLNV